MNLNYETVGINFNSKGKVDEIATPQNICDDMSTLFDYTDCNRKIWMDMYCKTGNFLSSLKRQGVDKNNIAAICQTLQSQMLVCRKLYGKILPEVEVEIKIKSLESCKVTRRGQVYYISNWKDKVRYNYQEAYNIIKFVVMKEMERTMSLDWTTEDNFQINNIIMNPPYNSDLYIDFVKLAHNIARENVIAITPAKWQAKSGQNNEDFRKNIVPYMSKIVYYPDCTDIFVIQEPDGVCYYLIDKEEHIKKEITNICLLNKMLNCSEVRPINNSLCIKADDIISKVKSMGETPFNPNKYKIGDYNVFTNDSIAIGGKAHKDSAGRYTYVLSNNGNFMCISKSEITEKNNKPNVKNSCLTFSSTKYDECVNFIRWTETRFVRFLFFAGLLARNSIGTDYGWRFVPEPKAFDHIFTDDELYKKYSLTDEEIRVIESVIKERK